MESSDGFLPFHWDTDNDRIYLEVNNVNIEFLYVSSLAAGVGSNDIGLDRGQLGQEKVVKFEQHGNKLMLVQPNQGYRAISDNQDEVNSVKEAFASSILWGFDIVAKSDWSNLIDITDFIIRDSHKVAGRLSGSSQGNYRLEKSRSALYRDNTLNFPDNTEFEATITLTGKPEGYWIRSVTPTAEAVTVRMHHSFVRLPDNDYQTRKFDPRSGFIHISYQDYATPIESPLVKRFITRHRLEKKDPNAAMSEAVEPIVYYLDRGAPEPIRSALLDGARWWNQAFEAAGFKDAFKVELLPEGAHPLDVRYNVIQWVHRSTRGWSYGASVIDPRTGEIIKGHVSLGSLRVRQDFLIAQGLLNQYDEGTEPMKELALARLRQLSAHEVGHTIGLVHNYAASPNDRASVMDYPHPYVKLTDGEIDLSEAYDDKIGQWDKTAITYGYAQFTADVNEADELENILTKAIANGELFISDRDARAQDGAHPVAHLWDNGASAADELNRMMEVRDVVLNRLSENSLPTGEPYSSLEEVLVPMYLFHRFQLEAASKVVGGVNYTYSVKGDNQLKTELIPAEDQMAALDALINTIKAESLSLPKALLMKIPPKAFGYSRNRETFSSKTGPAWDYYTAVETAAEMTLHFLLNPERMNRLVMYNDIDPAQPGLRTVLDKLIADTWKKPATAADARGIERIVEWSMLEKLASLSVDNNAHSDTKSIARKTLVDLMGWAKAKRTSNAEDKAHYENVVASIQKWLEEPEKIERFAPVKAPDGSPIGMDMMCGWE
ncbi:MAG: zinc-dependent metalloprotease [Cyclobacteriaceae bacterium]